MLGRKERGALRQLLSSLWGGLACSGVCAPDRSAFPTRPARTMAVEVEAAELGPHSAQSP